MKSILQEKESKTENIKIEKSLTTKYKDKNFFADKLTWAKEHFKDRDLSKEILEIEKKEKY